MADPNTPPLASGLLSTKLRRPRPQAALVPRPRLLQALTAGLDRRLILVSAPAGYGKTTVVSQWLDSVARPWAWISLDEQDNDLAAFVGGLLAAVRSVYPQAGRATEALLRAPALPAPGRLANSLLQDLTALPGELILVLDDYHRLQTQDVHGVTERLVQHLPDPVHLVLTARADPPLPLERLRGCQQLTEIRSVDLSFTRAEAAQLLRQALGAAATDEIIAVLAESTEGWAVGLQLAALSLRGRDDPVEFAARIAESGPRLVADYLLAEVLAGLPAGLRTGLLQVSILDRFCAPLCDAVCGEAWEDPAGDDFPRAARRFNLFLVPLDDAGTWFRYHPLFQYLLRNRLRLECTAVEIGRLHARASAWFAGEGFFDEAIAHAVQAGDIVSAARLVEEQVHPTLDREDWRQVERWLALLPAEARNRPRLLVAQAWLSHVRYQFALMASLLDAADAALARNPMADPAGARVLRGEMSTLRASLASQQNDWGQMERLAQGGLEDLRPDMAFATGLAKNLYAIALYRAGRNAAAVEFALKHTEGSHTRQGMLSALRPMLALAEIYYEMADLPALKTAGGTLLQMTREAEYGLSAAWAHNVLGWVHYQLNELPAAGDCFRKGALKAASAHGRAVIDGYTGLALTALAQGQPQEALAAIAELRTRLVERGMLAYSLIADSLEQRVALAGDPASAPDWRPARSTVTATVEFWEQPATTYVRTLLARGTAEGLAQAAEILAEGRAEALARQSRRRLIQVAALEALLAVTQGDEPGALAHLREAVELAAPGGVLRILVDCGPGLIGPLQNLLAGGVAPGFVRQLLAVYEVPAAPAAAAGAGPRPGLAAATPGIPPGTLTHRELDVLVLLAERLSDKEIADRLVLSLGTVRKHTLHIYDKLGVHNRREAAAAAYRLGLI